MKKSLIAAAVAAAIVAPAAANANVVIYGRVHVSIDNYDAEGDSQWEVNSRASRIGFKGTEDLGNGLSLIWKAETTYDFADGGAWGSGRNAYIGLAGDWGTFLYGRHDTPYKMAYYAGGVEMMADTVLDFGDTGELDISRVRASNAIAYVSPNMNGLTIAAAIVPGEGNNFDNGTGLADAVSVSGMYSNNGLKLAAAYEDLGSNDTKFMVTAGYTMNNVTVAGLYQDYEDDKSLLLSAGIAMGNNNFVLKYGQTDWDGGSDDTTMWGIGAEHNLSKRTKAYVGYASVDEANSSTETAFSVGMLHNF
jgi:predicted porin